MKPFGKRSLVESVFSSFKQRAKIFFCSITTKNPIKNWNLFCSFYITITLDGVYVKWTDPFFDLSNIKYKKEAWVLKTRKPLEGFSQNVQNTASCKSF